jgi:hypothetical protein
MQLPGGGMRITQRVDRRLEVSGGRELAHPRQVTLHRCGQDGVLLVIPEVGRLGAHREGHNSSEAATSSRCERPRGWSAAGAR